MYRQTCSDGCFRLDGCGRRVAPFFVFGLVIMQIIGHWGKMIDFISKNIYTRKKASLAHYNFAPRYKEVWLRDLKRHTANVLNREVPEVDFRLPHSRLGTTQTILALRSLLVRFESSCFRKTWLVSSVGQSTTLRTSVSGVRISHESQNWRLGRVGLLHRS